MKLSNLKRGDVFHFKGNVRSCKFMGNEKLKRKRYYYYQVGFAICTVNEDREVVLIDSPRSKKWYNKLIKKLW